ncbi:MAG: hypothetical protein V4556_03215 [Bacteroidota bacterium]
MKAIIYAGIGLFSVASLYGVADFYQEQKKGKFNTLYKKDKVPVVEIVPDTIASIKDNNVVSTKNEAGTPKKRKYRKVKKQKVEPEINLESFSRGRIKSSKPPYVPIEEEKSIELPIPAKE